MVTTTVHILDTAPRASVPLLEDLIRTYGRLPNLHGVMAESPGLLEAYLHLHRLAIEGTAFTPEERTVVWMTANVANASHYCVPAHTAIAHRETIDARIVQALRDETPLPPRLEALRDFTLALRESHGRPGADAIAAFEAAGYGERAILDTILIYAQKVMSNFTNAVFDTPTDIALAPFAWSPKASVAAQ
ncbi:carboxymuconolactone decarboxylase family protein [uncultured Tateyamaria sp.]|uniref:carboxymuconolactone decarboxylase family protein n=1 Tax=uncultured Tateyamaria sp. TaxID=455651 RepID=UPI0026158D52|nr:carboxymuconolactone decarboxylase family protein [uncultured Tateyamaria sp.]